MTKYKEIRLILADQLNSQHSWYREKDEKVLFVCMEIRAESEYVTHHIQKIVGLFQAMRTFAKELRDAGHAVKYFKIGDEDNRQSFKENLQWLLQSTGATALRYQQPDEWRLDQLFENLGRDLGVSVQKDETEHFLVDGNAFKELFNGRYFMESFYRKLRKKHGVLMDGDQPLTGKWNYDQENRKKLPAKHHLPPPKVFTHDVTGLFGEIESANLPFIGRLNPDQFIWPKNRSEALELLDYFFDQLFGDFGRYQDALTDRSWSLYHSRISFALNSKMLHPLEIVRAAESHLADDHENIASVEGFIRQILGWREYMRAIYWMEMPTYADKNYFEAKRKLPDFYWTGRTKMACMKQAIEQSLDHAYAHHIQRLMVTGNFAMLSGIDPTELDAWYLGIYIDAFEWVELPNTRGMSQYADGGLVGTKPYAASAAYLHKMGDHCGKCAYDHKRKTGLGACPFNSLYWDFLARHRELLGGNQRMSMMYRVWDKYAPDQQREIRDQAAKYLKNIADL